ncbi:MAG: DUF1926 domain-containing protein [Betaproteobacteria bacterium]|nr:DUF1926 domain-containing protein [Betaproteobacteria bacterium]
MTSLSLLFGVHAHQPVGNFHSVLEDAHSRCYRPFLETVHQYPEFRFAIHISGWLLDYLARTHPEDLARLRTMVARGQAELFGGGDTEPVLAAIPHRDRVGQVRALADKLERLLGKRPEGAWLTERVWDATVVPGLHEAGIAYTTVDDYHFLCTGLKAPALKGFFSTEEGGTRLDLFPISEELRYRFPFSPAGDAVAYLEGLADTGGQAAAIYFDDIEKFGIWPETYQWVYEQGWLRDFIEGVLGSPRIRTLRYADYHAQARTRGVVYLPVTSYVEMNEWTLPAEAADRYAELLGQAKAAGTFNQDKAFLRGGIWKNFMSRYAEANWMHKRMLGLSERFHALAGEQQTEAMRTYLYEAQANDAYWHGLFGGLYLPHLRRAVYAAIVRLEGLLDQVSARPPQIRADVDLDGHDEIFLSNGCLQAVVRLDGRASVCELDDYALGHNFGDTLARRIEHYYRKIQLREISQDPQEGIASAHDRVAFKHEIVPADLVPDVHPRHLFNDRWCTSEEEYPLTSYVLKSESADEAGVTLACQTGEQAGLWVTKRISLSGRRLRVAYKFNGQSSGRFLTDIHLAMPSCDGPAGRFVADGRILGGFASLLTLKQARALELHDGVLQGALTVRASRPVTLTAQPLYTVSQSEAGFEKIMQAIVLSASWDLGRRGRACDVVLELEMGPEVRVDVHNQVNWRAQEPQEAARVLARGDGSEGGT